MTPDFENASAAAGRATRRMLHQYPAEDVALALLVSALGVAAAGRGEDGLEAAKAILADIAGGAHGD